MPKTISANTGAVYLTVPSDSPLTILTDVTVSASLYGVHGSNSQAWAVTNQGTISGKNADGLFLGDGGTVANSGTAALIYGGVVGVYVRGGADAVTNQGTIYRRVQ